MGIQATASKTALLLQCPRPFASSVEIEPDRAGDAANYGTAFHEHMACEFDLTRSPGKRGADVDAALMTHVKQASQAMRAFIGGQNPWKIKFQVVGVELAGGLDFVGNPVKVIFDPENHTYAYDRDRIRPLLIAGSADLILEPVPAKKPNGEDIPRRLILDYKTGRHGPLFHKPAEMPQMQALAVIFGASHVGIVDTPADGIPQIYCDAVESIDKIIMKLQDADQLVAEGDKNPLMRTGPECRYCPARHDCPTRSADVVRAGAALAMVSMKSLGDLTATISDTDIAGRFHALRGELAKLEKLALDEIREMVRGGLEVSRPDGKILVLENRTYERLSKASILRAYGPDKGAKVLEGLREKGALVEETREELRAK